MNNLKRWIRRLLPKQIIKKAEKLYRLQRGIFWQIRFGFPARKLRVIAITGTNGKSTTAAYTNEILKAADYKTAVLTTVFYEVDGERSANKTHFTIDKQSIVQSFMAKAKKAGVDFVILEVTSHAIDQGRIMGVPVEIAVITNLTQDHLDYHGTMEEYAAVKARLLTDYGATWAVLNSDDKYFEYFKARAKTRVLSFGKSAIAELKITGVNLSPIGGQMVLVKGNIKQKIKTNLIGEFNLYNAAAAASVGKILNVDDKAIERGVANLKSLDGRMELINPDGKFAVYVDFAITPDALEKALSSLQKVARGNVRVVFGATGDRDKDKRPKMGQVAARHADFIYLTDDETYTEDPEQIRQAVYAGIEKAGGKSKTKVIEDRKKAINQAIKEAKTGDAVLLAGIGHETERNMGGKSIPWNEKTIALSLLTK
jgi:UDP-N-acetylmuramoyl-L-alanyl-D-glutamate--2,6-diaminopimelate ligase